MEGFEVGFGLGLDEESEPGFEKDREQKFEEAWVDVKGVHMLKKIKVFREFTVKLKNENISSFAAGTAFFLFLSLIPICMLFFAILPYTPISQSDALEIIYSAIPGLLKEIVEKIVAECYEKSFALLSVSAIVIIWAAAKATLALTYGLNSINGVIETKNYVVMRLKACLEIVIMLLAVVLSLVLMVFGNVLVELVLSDFPRTMAIYQFAMKFRFLLSWAILTLVFTTMYTTFPTDKSLKWKKQIPGAAFSAIAWSVFSWFFSVYVEYYEGFTMYGSFATIVIVMLWMYFCMYILLLGAYLNKSAKSTLLELIVAGEDENTEDWEHLKKVIRNKDVKAMNRMVKSLNEELVSSLKEVEDTMTEEEQKEMAQKIRQMWEEKKKEKRNQEEKSKAEKMEKKRAEEEKGKTERIEVKKEENQ